MSTLERAADGRPWRQGRAAPLAAWLAALEGWRRYGLACLLGFAAAGALPPADVTPLLWAAFVGLLWLDDGTRSGPQAFALGWWFGLGYFLAGLYWVGISMLVDPLRFGWMIPFAVGGLSAGMALYPATALWLTWLSGTRGTSRILLLAANWSLCEWLRGHLLSGFPWNLIGSVWSVSTATMQLGAAIGILGLGLLTVIVASLPSLIAGPLGPEPWVARRPWLPPLIALALVAALWGGGAWRLAEAESATVPGITLRIVQPNIAESLKWQPGRLRENLAETMQLSSGPGLDHVSAILWPEASVPYDLAAEPALRQDLGDLLPANAYLLTGTPRREAVKGASAGSFRYFNSLEALDHAGNIIASYDKFHLVPYGEYVPLRSVLPIQKITPGTIDFTPGHGPRTLDLPGLPPFGPLICYEVIFPDEVVQPENRPSWLLNVTNDAWFGSSSGPYQHFESARMRAIEQGLPLVRVANTGISAVIDPYGRVIARLGLGLRGSFDSGLPRALAAETLYARYGDALLLVMLAVTGALAWLLRRAR
jgi:apolipoprotein N-acyltransferase